MNSGFTRFDLPKYIFVKEKKIDFGVADYLGRNMYRKTIKASDQQKSNTSDQDPRLPNAMRLIAMRLATICSILYR